jgi:hypothetical protein
LVGLAPLTALQGKSLQTEHMYGIMEIENRSILLEIGK